MTVTQKPTVPSTASSSVHPAIPLREQIKSAGWKQGAIFPKGILNIPSEWNLSEDEILVVCTQSCSVVSGELEKDPLLELIIAKPLSHFPANSTEASGKNVRKLVVPIEPVNGSNALELQIHRRHFIQRYLITEIAPDSSIQLTDEAVTALANWLGRYYTRIDLPDSLSELITQKNGLRDVLKDWLQEKCKKTGQCHHLDIKSIHIKWAPHGESDQYDICLKLICSKDETCEAFEEFKTAWTAISTSYPQLNIELLDCALDGETLLSDLEGYKRFSEFDYITRLENIEEPSR